MGATNFENTVKGDDPEKAYRELVDEALYDRGHDAYNGTISTTSGWHLVRQTPFEDENEAWEFATGWSPEFRKQVGDGDIENAQKWEAARCVKFMQDGEVWLLFYGWAAC